MFFNYTHSVTENLFVFEYPPASIKKKNNNADSTVTTYNIHSECRLNEHTIHSFKKLIDDRRIINIYYKKKLRFNLLYE